MFTNGQTLVVAVVELPPLNAFAPKIVIGIESCHANCSSIKECN